jgi:hypothetical protein
VVAHAHGPGDPVRHKVVYAGAGLQYELELHRALQERMPEEFARAHTENQLCEPLITAGNFPSLGTEIEGRLKVPRLTRDVVQQSGAD